MVNGLWLFGAGMVIFVLTGIAFSLAGDLNDAKEKTARLQGRLDILLQGKGKNEWDEC